MHRGLIGHRLARGLVVAALGCALGAGAARACDNSIQPVGGSDGYQNRIWNGCEGLYESPVSGPPLELVSLTWGAFPSTESDHPDSLTITAQPSQHTLYVRAEGIPAGLYYRMDSVMKSAAAPELKWPMTVVKALKLDLATIGILAYADDPDGTAFVPASVAGSADGAAPAVAEIRPLVPIDALRWRVLDGSGAADADWNDADARGDCFVISIPRSAVAHKAYLQVAWDDPGSGQSQSKEFLIEP